LQGNLRGSTIPRLEREVAGLAVSYENDCAYPMAAHSTFANAAGESPETLAALRGGQPLDEPFAGQECDARATLGASG
jgi:AhpD family alkylhydroperoxidase